MKKNIKSVSEIYICPKKAGNKFRSARKFHTPLYLYGVTGIGKTALILNNVNMKKCSYYSATTILADEINIEKKTTEHTVVIDDLQSLADSSQKEAYFEKIKELLGREDIWLILISRCPFPRWLLPLRAKYIFVEIEEEDFLSAEIEVVPAGPARDCGLDRSMIAGYGHDDRVCAYPSFAAMMEAGHVDRTSCCLLVDKEEIGSVGATGMQSMFFENTVAEILALMGQDSNLAVRRTLARSRMLSSDVSAAYDPAYAEAFEKKNCAYFGKGMVINKYTGARGKSGSNDANAEYLARLRRIFDDNKVAFQTAELGKVDYGGGGTIAYIAALYGMEVVDSGVAVLSMHAPWEIISKSDLYEAKKGYVAFLKNA